VALKEEGDGKDEEVTDEKSGSGTERGRKERKRRWLICKSGCRGGEWKGRGSG
jgi:hypothetical protein